MTELYRNIYLDGQRLHVPVTDGFTPQMHGAYPDTGNIVSDGFQSAVTAAAGGTLLVSAGVWLLDRNIQIPANIVIEMHPGAILDWTAAPLGTIGMTAQGTLGAIVPLVEDSYAIGPSEVWVGSTVSTPSNYVVNDRVSYQGISWRCVTNHTASKPTDFSVAAAAMYHDAITLGLWQRTSFKPVGGLNGIAVGDWFVVQDNERYDTAGLSTYRGEVVRALEVDEVTGTITAQGTLHYDYLVSRAAFVRKLGPLDNIRIRGGHLRFRTDVAINNSVGILFSCCSNVKVIGLEAEALVACVSVQDTVNFEGTGCYFHDGRGLGYGWAVSNNCAHVNINNNFMTQARHSITVSASPDRSGPMHVKFIDNHVDCSLRYTPGPTSPFGGTGDAVDTHAGCDYVEFSGNTILNSSGSGIHVEAPHATVRNNTIDGCYFGMSISNNTSVAGTMDITGNVVLRCNSTGFSVRTNAGGATYSYVNLTDNSVDDVGGVAYYVTGLSDKRIGGLTFLGNRASNSRSGGYMSLLTYCDNPEISGYVARHSLPTQSSLGMFNFAGGYIDGLTAIYPEGSTATALLLSNNDNELLRAGRATNIGNGTITQTPPVLQPGYQDGIYKTRCTATAANGGTFTFFDVDGTALGTVAVGVEWNTFVKFTINDGTVDYALGDGWDFQVVGDSVTTTKTANNVGGATLDVVDGTVVDDDKPEGIYLVTCSNATPPATWAVTDPTGASMGSATTGVAYSTDGLEFTITAAGLPTAVGDVFSVRGTHPAHGLEISGVKVVSPNPGINRGFFFGTLGRTERCYWSAENDVSQAYTIGTLDHSSGHVVRAKQSVEVRTETTSMTWTAIGRTTSAICSGTIVVLTGAIAANRVMTLAQTNATDGVEVLFKVQNGVPGFHWSVGGLIDLIDGQWARFTYSETLAAWLLVATG